jgi:hypothetical protein
MFWVVLALFFGGYIWLSYDSKMALDYYSAYFMEISLSVDNIFVFVLIFKSLQIDEKEIINYLQNIFKNQEIKELRYNIIMREISLHKTHLELRDHIKNDLKKSWSRNQQN